MREKVDDNNVRVGSLSQEVDALRQLVQQALARPVAPPVVVDPNGGPALPPRPGPDDEQRRDAAGVRRADAHGHRHVADEGVGAGVRRLRGRPVRSRGRRLHRLHPRLPQTRPGRRCAVPDRTVVSAGRQERQGRRSVRQGDPHVPDEQLDSRRVLPEGRRAPESRQLDRAREAWDTVIKNYPDSAGGQPRQAGARDREALTQTDVECVRYSKSWRVARSAFVSPM